MVERDAQPGSAIRSTAAKCLHNTRSMIEACTSINGAGVDQGHIETTIGGRKHSSEETQDQPTAERAKKARNDQSEPNSSPHVPPVTDASGLFTIDPNPTAVNILLNDFNKPSNSKKSKRRHSEQESTQAPNEEVYVNGGDRATKRVKTVQPSPQELEEHNKSFEAKVELRLKQKEQDRQKKASKKRKHESDGLGEIDGTSLVQDDLTGHLHPKQTPRQKRKSDLKAQLETDKQQDLSATMTEVKQANTKRCRRTAAEAADSSIQEELATGTKRKGQEFDDVSANAEYGESRKRKKPKSRLKHPEG